MANSFLVLPAARLSSWIFVVVWMDTGQIPMMQLPRTAVSFVVGTACEGSTRYWLYREEASTIALPASPATREDDLHLEFESEVHLIYRLP